MKRVIAAIVLWGCVGVLPARAFAVPVDVYGTTAAETIWIGMVLHGGATSQYVCVDGPSASDATWTWIGLYGGMLEDHVIHGDPSDAAGAADTMRVLRSTTYVSGDCAGSSGTSWRALDYGVAYLDVHGEYGADYVYGGAGDTFAEGNSGADYVYNYSGVGVARGNADGDVVLGLAGSGDTLYGDAGVDCLDDGSNSWSGYDCGADDDYYESGDTSSGKLSCNLISYTCCGFCE